MTPRTQPELYGAPVEAGSRKGLWIDVRDAASGERRTEIYDAPVPAIRADREAFLNRQVPTIFPGARLRSYSGGAATFICGSLLIAAHYGAIREDAQLISMPERAQDPVADGVGQGTLFAA
jgi:hypothetical protein